MRRRSGIGRGRRHASRGVVVGDERARVGWVLGGGGARGAYEIGVCDYIFEQVAGDLGGPVPLDILCGTSVGALHVCALAAGAADPRAAARALVERRGNGEFRRGARLPERSISANDAMRLAA
jgi:predicted acylesterase/phospholipase RssA